MKIRDTELIVEQNNTKTLKEYLSKYVANWYVFLIILTICISAGFLYSRYMTPKYMATLAFLVKNTESGAGSSNDLIEEALNGKRAVNLNNEMLIIGSSALMERVVRKENFNIGYYKVGSILNIEIYLDAPFRLSVKEIKDSALPAFITVQAINSRGGTGFIGADKKGASLSFQWNRPFVAEGKTFVLSPVRQIKNGDGNYLVTWRPIASVASELLGSLSVTPFDVKTSAIELSLKSENLQRGKDILNAAFREFNSSDIEDRNKVAENTVNFINDRLASVSTELKGVEGNIENYQGSKRLVNIKEQSTQSLSNANDISKAIKDLGIQQGVADMILGYFKNPDNSNKLVPTSLGLNDATLSSLINQYNELQLKKEREAPSVAPNSTVMQDLNTQTNNIRSSILESLNNITKNLNFQERNFQQRSGQYNQFLSSLPHNERVLQEIKRKQGITEGLYLYLMQKREEAAISGTASNISHYKQIDLAKGYGPVEPNMRNWIVISTLLGLFLSFGLIYLKDLLNDKVSNRQDVTDRLNLQIFGDISHVAKQKKSLITVLTHDVISEQFRAIRTNLSFMLKNKPTKTILITSSSANEGKSFVTLNLASVCAAPGKKVALLEFDIRKPELRNTLHIDSEKGITDFLTGEIDDLAEIFHVAYEIPTLHIYPSGPVLSNPADLLLTENVARLFEALKYQYDYIIVDSPPAGLVSDAFILSEFSDLVLYVIRQRTTIKKQLDFINDIDSSKRLGNIGLILNDMKTGGKYGYHSYGYGNYSYPKRNIKA